MRGIITIKMALKKPWFTLLLTTVLYLEVNSSQCYRRYTCNKCRQTVDCPQNKTHVNIIFQPNYIDVVCKSSTPRSLNILPVFDGRYLATLDNGRSLTLDTMVKKCFRTKYKHIKYNVDLDKVKKINIGKMLFKDETNLEYLNIGWTQNFGNHSSRISLEETFLEYTPNIQTLILNHSDVNQLKNYFKHVPGLVNLDLSSNYLEEIPPGVLDNLVSLDTVVLMNNKLKLLKNGIFSKTKLISMLDVSGNQIATLEDQVFGNLENLLYLNLSHNNLKVVKENIFLNNRELEVLDLSSNPRLMVPKALFKNLTALRKLLLNDCGIKTLDENMFDHLRSLRELQLMQNELENLSGNIFQYLVKLEVLDLANNKFESLPDNIFATLDNLREISLRGNRLKIFSDEYFEDLRSLKVLDLSSNKISDVSVDNFNPHVETLILSRNKLSQVPDIVADSNALDHLDLSHNAIRSLDMKYPIPKDKHTILDVSNNKIEKVDLPDPDVTGHEGSIVFNLDINFVRCSCSKYKVDTRNKRNDFMRVTLSKNNTVCSTKTDQCSLVKIHECPDKCECYYRNTDTSMVVDCSYRDLTLPPTLEGLKSTGVYKYNQTVVSLKGNNLKSMGQQKLQGYRNVTWMDLSDNVITEFLWVPPHLQYLNLDGNRLQNINRETVRALEQTDSLNEITLKNNPWKCECNSADLQKYLISYNNIKVNQSDVTCQSTGEYLIYTKICDQTLQNSLTVPISLTLLFAILAIGLTLYYRYNTSIKIYLYSKSCCLWCVAEEELDKEKTYDIFVSYSYKDEDFVQKELLPQLEHPQRPFKVCIHYRDFIPGEFISKQIVDSVLNSRRTLVVLSNNFMESVWGKMEFRTAHTQAISEGRARVIVVIFGDLNEDTLDDEMKAYLKTNTYVKWGDPWFWNKLLYALPHSSTRFNNTEVISIEQTCDKSLLGCFKWLTKTRNITVGTGNKGSFDLEKINHSHTM